ncbi:MAG TPA: hypothetical protein IGS53_22925 [Leptolyngbyaceae cyanobacterium M33_DOE_097]|uniref:Uncharacterized protein n=1 Tax=Oscillatoriales cyanobacterium SpSt-418 TaxID=2282169 RepID=A0A7C3PEY3_9CYAN|nr:hypothetical protein [Leptolyngbyaceae cyanobacterium M33_DOE_097]
MDYQITKSEIKKLSLEFRGVVNRLFHVKYDSGINDLKRFLTFIERNPIIYDFIVTHQVKDYDIPSIIRYSSSVCDRYEIPEDKLEEISFTYQLLKYGAENFEAYMLFTVEFGGAYGKSFQQQIDTFNKVVVFPFYRHIETHLSILLIDFGDEEQKTINVHVYGDYMEDRSVNIQSGDINNQGLLNLGTINGAVTQTINQLKETSVPESAQLVDLLTQLQAVIETEPALPLDEKESALEQVKLLAEAGQSPKEGAMQKVAKGAVRMLKGIREELPTATKFLEETNKLLPLITKLFGF